MSKVKSITPLPPADFTPELGNYKTLQPFRYWCQKVLPLVYDNSLTYYELLCKVVDYLNKTMEDVETLCGDVTNLHIAYEQLQNYVNMYFSSLDVQQEINNKLDEMVKDGTFDVILKQYFIRKYIFIGDSYILACDSLGHQYTSYATYIIENLKIDCSVIGESGAGFKHIGDSGHTFLDLLKTYTGNKNLITDIYFFGGYNDRTEESPQIIQSIIDCCTYCRENYPTAKLHCGMIGWATTGEDYEKLRMVSNSYSRASMFGMNYISFSECILHNTAYMSDDGFHPNNEGHQVLANYLSNAIIGNTIDVQQIVGTITPPEANGCQLGAMKMMQNNDTITISMYDFYNINLSAFDATYWGTNWFNISDVIPNTPVVGYQNTYVTGSLIWNPIDSQDWYSAPFSMKMVNKKWYIQIQALAINGNGLYNGKIQQAIIPPFSITCPTQLS